MTAPNRPRRLLQSIGAVVAGVFAIVVLSIGTDVLLHALGVLTEPMSHAQAALALTYRCIYGVLGAYLTARLAPTQPLLHALIFGMVGLIVSCLGVVATWNAGEAYGPKWYAIALAATTLPCAWVGGKLDEWRTVKSAK